MLYVFDLLGVSQQSISDFISHNVSSIQKLFPIETTSLSLRNIK